MSDDEQVAAPWAATHAEIKPEPLLECWRALRLLVGIEELRPARLTSDYGRERVRAAHAAIDRATEWLEGLQPQIEKDLTTHSDTGEPS